MEDFNFENFKNRDKNFKNFLEAVSFLEKEKMPDLLFLDFDGVLLEVSYKQILKGLYFYLKDENKFKNFIKQNKVSFSFLKKIIDLSKKTKIVILTGRFLEKNKEREKKLKNVFPFISEDFINNLEKKFNIKLIPNVKKNLIDDAVKDLIKDNKCIFYFGSSFLDKMLFKKMKNINKNITYFHVGNNKML